MSSHLLPKTVSQFSSKEFWNQFFTKLENDEFEWYGKTEHLWPLIAKYIKISDYIVIVGCGNSSLNSDLYDMGIVNNIGIDISDVVIEQMTRKYTSNDERKCLQYMKMDMLKMTFADNYFNVVIDKGTLDAIAADDSHVCHEKVEVMFKEISRVLKPFGRYICVSLLQTHILVHLLNWFSTNGHWLIRIQRCHSAEKVRDAQANDDPLILPVFVIICTKLHANSDGKLQLTIYEIALSDDFEAKPKRLNSSDDVIKEIESLQQFAFIKYGVKNFKMTFDDDFCLHLFNSDDTINPRFVLHFIDYRGRRKTGVKHKYGIFIVPQGREIEWLFASRDGQLQLIKQTNFEKLMIVHLNRNHKYANLEEIKNELSEKILELIPKSVLRSNEQIPYLSIGDDIGTRTVVFKGNSEFSGDYIIEDVNADGDVFRRLIFLKTQNIIQSETKLKFLKKGKKMMQFIDHSYLLCKHHEIIASSLIFTPKEHPKQLNLLLVGLGGGCLPSYLQINLANVKIALNIDIIEIDSAMYDVATKWFGLKTQHQTNNIKLNVHIDDGIDFITNNVQMNQYDAIIFDVDSKDVCTGIGCPPKEFVDIDFLKRVKQILKDRSGFLILNLVSRDKMKKKEIYQRINNVFEKTFLFKMKEDINEILISFVCDGPKWFKNNADSDYVQTNVSDHYLYLSQLKRCYEELCSQLKVL